MTTLFARLIASLARFCHLSLLAGAISLPGATTHAQELRFEAAMHSLDQQHEYAQHARLSYVREDFVRGLKEPTASASRHTEWRNGDVWRTEVLGMSLEQEGGAFRDFITVNSPQRTSEFQRSLTSYSNSEPRLELRADISTRQAQPQFFQHIFLGLLGGDPSTPPSQRLGAYKKSMQSHTQEVDGRKLLKITWSTAGAKGYGETSFWLDPQFAYQPRLIRHTGFETRPQAFDSREAPAAPRITSYSECRVTSFLRSGPACVPSSLTMSSTKCPENEEPHLWMQYSVQVVEFEHQPTFAADAFADKFPAGTRVFDQVDAVQYTVGPNGERQDLALLGAE